jgi:hypothetical protein
MLLIAAGRSALAAEAGTISGSVLLPDGSPASGARVRIQAGADFTVSDGAGLFSLGGLAGPSKVVAALEGFRNAIVIPSPGNVGVAIELGALPATDNRNYVWDPPITCAQCHPTSHQEWARSPLAISAADPIVLSIYRGTKYDGTPSDGFGFRKSHPETYGDCAFCHAPAFTAKSADVDDPLEPHHDLVRALTEGSEAERSGVICDFCHKVQSVVPSGDPPRPGKKFTLLRPPQFEPLMFGPLDDVSFVGMGASFSPMLERTSDLCALCHWRVNAQGVTVASNFPEWRDGPYPAQGKRCPDCHMKPDEKVNFFCTWEPVIRDPKTIYLQTFQGNDASHLSEALSLDVAAERSDGAGSPEIRVEVKLTNSGAGHAIPAGVTMRQILLVVEARRSTGELLALADGPRLPSWAGEGGTPEKGYLAGLPGKGYAKILTDGTKERVMDSEATAIVSDNRIFPLTTDASSYRFALDGYAGPIDVKVRTIHRKWWKDLQDERGFPDGDAPMVEKSLTIPGIEVQFIRGDTDLSGKLDLSDAVTLLGHLFTGQSPILPCPDAADADDSGSLDLTDAVKILGYLFLGADAPPAPFPLPGSDPTPDALDC